EWKGTAERIAHEAPDLALPLEQLLEVLQGGVRDEERVAEDVLLRSLQRLHQHEIDREQAVDRSQEHETRMADLHPQGSRVHVAFCSQGSKSRNRTKRTPSRSGTSVNDSAEAGPN